MIKLAFGTFLPAEAASISGVDVEDQRMLRRRGYLPRAKGKAWARFTVTQVAALLVLHILRRHGLGPQTAWPIAEKIAPALAAHLHGSTQPFTHKGTAALQRRDSIPAALAKAFGFENPPGEYAVIWQSGDVEFTNSVDKSLEHLGPTLDYDGSALALDLDLLAYVFANRAARPFIRVEAHGD